MLFKNSLGKNIVFSSTQNWIVEGLNEKSSPLVDSATPKNIQPLGLSGFNLSFSDEFTTNSLNTSKWQPYYPDTPFWNATQPGGHLTNTNEPQAYDLSAISFENSELIFTMRNESIVDGLPYTSGMITSYPSFTPTYGFFEARMKLNSTEGMWPAFWMDLADQSWPPEIDIMESWGGWGNEVQSNLILPNQPYQKQAYQVQNREDWNTFGVHWTAEVIKFYINGYNHFTVTHPDIPKKPMYLIANLAGDKDKVPTPEILPQSIRIDYIRGWTQ